MFKYKCFIRQNNQFLRDTLKKLGYVEMLPNDKDIIISTNDGHGMNYFTSINENSVKNLGNMYIDCGDSETLFLAVSSMTDEHDKFQFFTTLSEQHWVNQGVYCPKGSLEFCMVTDRYFGKHPIFDSTVVPARKTSVEELLETFKDIKKDTEYFSKIPEERWKKNELDYEKNPLSEKEKEVLNEMNEKQNDVCVTTYESTDC